jgi:hypothetical protein
VLSEGEPWFVDQRLQFPLTLEACVSGEPGRCHEFVLGPREQDRHLRALGIWPDQGWALRPGEITWLNDVLQAFGAERFADFWSTDEDLREGFVQAFGVSLDDWTRTWARARFGDPARSASSGITLAGMSLAASAGFLLIAVAVAQRRRVA